MDSLQRDGLDVSMRFILPFHLRFYRFSNYILMYFCGATIAIYTTVLILRNFHHQMVLMVPIVRLTASLCNLGKRLLKKHISPLQCPWIRSSLSSVSNRIGFYFIFLGYFTLQHFQSFPFDYYCCQKSAMLVFAYM